MFFARINIEDATIVSNIEWNRVGISDLLDSISLPYVRNCTRRINLFFQLTVKETIFIPRLKKLIDYYARRVIVAK